MRAPWEAVPQGIRLHLRVTPKGGRDAIIGVRETADGRTHLAVRVSAAPDGGAANDAVCRLIAKASGVARGGVIIEAGAQSREKRIIVQGDSRILQGWIESVGVKA